MRDLPATLYTGELFSNTAPVIIPRKYEYLPGICAFCMSGEFTKALRAINPNVAVENGYVSKIHWDPGKWLYSDTTIPLPKAYADAPTQWIFKGTITSSIAPLHVAIARLLGYQWPEHELDELDELSNSDGIVCIPAVRGEDPAAERLRALLAAAYGNDWSPTKEQELIAATGSEAKDLDEWLRNDFFEQHCKLFHHRPFIWHIWDGRRRDGFHALVNYHKLAEGNGKGRQVLESLTYSYLGEWITRQKDGVKRGEGGAEDRLAAALELQKRLIAILEGEPPFDIFVRWKPIEKQPIGWEPDINDGVRINIRPFMASDIPGGRKGAGILRWKPNISWGKDRGKEPVRPQEQFPWLWKNGKFTGDRVNDVHLTSEEKRKARETMNRKTRSK